MSTEATPFITDDPPASADQHYELLRTEAINAIQSLTGQAWTDHNEHDTGITTADAVCFALTEQGHLNNISVRQLLQLHGKPGAFEKNFFDPAKVLHNEPVTMYDWRKLLVDQPAIRNAWLLPVISGTPPELFLKNNQYNLSDGLQVNLKGLYDVLIEWAPDNILDELNGNILSFELSVLLPTSPVPKIYPADLIFPFTWDTTEVKFIPFRNILNIQSIALSTDDPLHPQLAPQPEPGFYFSELKVTHNLVEEIDFAVSLRINTEMTTDLERQVVENAFILHLSAINGAVAAFNRVVSKAFSLSAGVRTLLLAKRNLAEDFVNLYGIKIQEIGIHAEIELTPGIPVEETLAGIFFRIHKFISPVFTFQSYDAETGMPDEVREGPLLQHGYLSDEQLRAAPARSIFLSDLLHVMLEKDDQDRHDKIVAVYGLSIQSYIDNKAAGGSEENCLRLVDDITNRPRLSVFKSQLIARERGVIKPYDPGKVYNLFVAMKNSVEAATPLLPAPAPVSEPELLPAAQDYYPLQFEFPAFYDLSIHEKTVVNVQMRGYLFFFEQLLAGYSTLLKHVPDLLAVDNVLTETRFPANIRQLLPFYNDYLKSSYETALATPAGENESRRTVMLDHLLARLGEDFRYYGAWNNKTGNALNLVMFNFLQALPVLAATRYQAYDYSQPAWNTPNISATEKKLVHLLQLPDNLRKKRWKDPAPHFSVVPTAGPHVMFGFRITDAGNAPLLKSPDDTFEFDFEAEDAATAVIQWGRSEENYRVENAGGAMFQFVLLNNERDIIAVSANTFPSIVSALGAITNAVNYFSTQWVPEEGVHLVENILLRPRVYSIAALTDTLFTIPLSPDNTIAPGFGRDLYSQQVLVALPAAGDRFGDPGFQEVTTAIIQKELPAWLQVRVVWLNIFRMHVFETAYETWVQTLSNPAATEANIQSAKDGMIKAIDSIHDWLSKK